MDFGTCNIHAISLGHLNSRMRRDFIQALLTVEHFLKEWGCLAELQYSETPCLCAAVPCLTDSHADPGV